MTTPESNENNSPLKGIQRLTSPTARSRDTREKVHAVALAMLRDGGRVPNVRSVRERIGRGSTTTISEELRVFWENVGKRLAHPDLPNTVADAAHEFWHLACEEARQALAKERERHQADIEGAQIAQAAAEQEIGALTARLKQEEARTRDLERALRERCSQAEDLDRQLVRENTARHQTQERLDEARRRCDALVNEKASELKALRESAECQLAEIRADREKVLALERTRAKETEERLVQRIDAERAERTKLEAELAKARDSLTKQSGELMELKIILKSKEAEVAYKEQAIAGTKDELKTVASERDALRTVRVTLGRDLAHAQSNIERLQQELKGRDTALRSRADELGVTRERLAARESEVSLLTKQLDAAMKETKKG